MADTETVALIALLRFGGRAWTAYAERIESQGGARSVLERELSEADDGQGTLLSPADPDELLARAAADAQTWETEGIRLVTVLDPDYPLNLRGVHDRPPLLFVAGQLRRTDDRSLAVIGTRTPTSRGADRAREIAGHLSDNGHTVISGLANGIDTAAHTAALTRAGRTVAVIGTGLHHCYPPENAELQCEIARKGAVVSQFWPDAGPTRGTFPMRNAVMSGLARGTIVVEASRTSGARIQARRALAHGRPVFLADTLLTERWARELAARPGTSVFDSPDEITKKLERLDPIGVLED